MSSEQIFFPLGKINHIAYIDNAISKETCDSIIELGEELFEEVFYQGPTMGGVQKHIKNCFDWGFGTYDPRYTEEQNKKNSELDAEVFNGLNKALTMYVENYEKLGEHWKNIIDTKYQVQKYLKNTGFYRSHIDGGPWSAGDVRNRILAAVIYLNTVEEGGGTFFDDHNITVDAVAGRISIFPAYWTHPHGGEVPISNDKWIISTFISVQNEEK